MSSSTRRLHPPRLRTALSFSTILLPLVLLATWPSQLVAQQGVDLRPVGSSESPAQGDRADEDLRVDSSPSTPSPEPPRFRISNNPEDLVIEFRELRSPHSEEFALRPRWQIYGDGRFERWPEPDPPRDPPMKMAPEALQALVRSLVVLNDLPAHAYNRGSSHRNARA